MPFALQPEERMRHEARGPGFVIRVTTRRLVATSSGTGNETTTYLPLENIDSVQEAATSSTIWLILGAIAGFIGLILAIAGVGIDDDFGAGVLAFGIFLIFVAVGLVAVWFLTRKQSIVFQSQQASISAQTQGLATNVSQQLLAAVESARETRLQELRGLPPGLAASLQPRTSNLPTAGQSEPPRIQLVD